jgi:hypothetical protein
MAARWEVGLYLDVYHSSYAYPQQWVALAGQQLITQKYNEIDGGFRFNGHF